MAEALEDSGGAGRGRTRLQQGADLAVTENVA
jgi:hypothetical protein